MRTTLPNVLWICTDQQRFDTIGLLGNPVIDTPNLNAEGRTGYGTMYRDERYKLIVYHGYDLGELYDLQVDPGEFDNRWSDPDFTPTKLDLMKKSFDASMLITDWGGVPYVRRKDSTPPH